MRRDAAVVGERTVEAGHEVDAGRRRALARRDGSISLAGSFQELRRVGQGPHLPCTAEQIGGI